jgi:hypothetical protein
VNSEHFILTLVFYDIFRKLCILKIFNANDNPETTFQDHDIGLGGNLQDQDFGLGRKQV